MHNKQPVTPRSLLCCGYPRHFNKSTIRPTDCHVRSGTLEKPQMEHETHADTWVPDFKRPILDLIVSLGHLELLPMGTSGAGFVFSMGMWGRQRERPKGSDTSGVRIQREHVTRTALATKGLPQSSWQHRTSTLKPIVHSLYGQPKIVYIKLK